MKLKDAWMFRWLGLFVLLALLAACSSSPAGSGAVQPDGGLGQGQQGGMGQGLQDGSGQGRGRRLMGGDHTNTHARHMAQVPNEYAGQTVPENAGGDLMSQGGSLYAQHCASCHGDGGMGDGPAGAALDPPPSPVAFTSTRMGDDYLFWRISEGGLQPPFSSAMPAWKDVLDEQQRWAVIAYLRALGRGEAIPQSSAGGAAFDPRADSQARAEMLAEAQDAGLISEDEAFTFEQVHRALDAYFAQELADGFTGRMEDVQADILNELAARGTISAEEAQTFQQVHDRLLEAGLMR